MSNRIPSRRTVSPLLFRDARRSFDRANKEGQSDKYNHTYEVIVTVILSVAAAEAFITELYVMFFNIPFFRMDKETSRKPDEFFKLSLEDKYCEVPLIIGYPLNTGESPFQDFHNLIMLRNSFVHYKMRDSIEGEKESYYRYLRAQNLLTDNQQKLGSTGFHWIDQVCNIKIAKWSVNTVSKMVRSLYDTMDNNTKVLFKYLVSTFTEID